MMKQEPLVVERRLSATINQVWTAITDASHMKQWYFDIPGFKPEIGYEFSFIGTDAEGKDWKHLCRVIEVVPYKKLTYSWRYDGVEGDSLVTWELFEEGPATRLRLTHAGLETFPRIESFARENFATGWEGLIGLQLPQFIDKEMITG